MNTGNRKRYGTMTGMALTAVLAATLLGACSGNQGMTPHNPNNQNSADVQSNSGQSNSGSGDQPAAPDNTANNNTGSGENAGTNTGAGGGSSTNTGTDAPSGKADLHDEEGTFTGQQDPHTVEIKTSSGPMTFQIDDRTAKAIADLAPDDKVTFQYREKKLQTTDGTAEQLWLTEIKKAP